MSGSNEANVTLTPSTNRKHYKNVKHYDHTDDYLRLVSSSFGKYLGSISNNRQLTIYNLES